MCCCYSAIGFDYTVILDTKHTVINIWRGIFFSLSVFKAAECVSDVIIQSLCWFLIGTKVKWINTEEKASAVYFFTENISHLSYNLQSMKTSLVAGSASWPSNIINREYNNATLSNGSFCRLNILIMSTDTWGSFWRQGKKKKTFSHVASTTATSSYSRNIVWLSVKLEVVLEINWKITQWTKLKRWRSRYPDITGSY